jgi:hypothetical protein
MKKLSKILVAAALIVAVPLLAASTLQFRAAAPGKTVLVGTGVELQNIYVTTVAGSDVMKVYDAATTSTASSSNLKLSIPLGTFAALSLNAATSYNIVIGANFQNGVVIDSGTATLTASTRTNKF